MRILYLHHGYFPHSAGAETMTYHIAHEMQQLGHQVGILRQRAGSDGEFGMQFPIIALDEGESISQEIQLPWQPDIIHVVDAVWAEYLQGAYELARRFSVPLAITPASTIDVWEDVPATLGVCRRADVLYVLTETERALFVSYGVAAERLKVIGQGAALDGIPDPMAFREHYAINGPMVLFLGRKIAFKGYKLLLQAMAEVWEQCPEAHFVYVGPQVDADSRRAFATYADPRVVEISMIDEAGKHSALLASELVCLPSVAEVFPLVFVEAWSCARPVIAGPFTGVEEIVHHGEDGLIIPPAPAAIADAVLQLLQHDEQRRIMGQAGLQRVRQEFNWRRVAEHIEQGYTQLMVSPSL